MNQPDDNLPSLESLQKRIDTAKSMADGKNHGDTPVGSRKFHQVAQLAGGLAAGAAVGGACGYGMDRWLATSPIGLITGFFLGFATGLYNVVREAEKDDDDDTKE